MSDSLQKYREQIVELSVKSQEAYDKTLITLSGGALGISIAFVKDIAGPQALQSKELLVAAWVCWLVSLISVLTSFFTSKLALDQTLRQIDSGKIYETAPGGFASQVTGLLNFLSGLAFIAGVVLIIVFVSNNL